MNPSLVIEGLRKSYGATEAVGGFSVEIAPGELVGLIGPDGAGKTTVMRSICGLVRPDAGAIRVLDADPFVQSQRVREVIGYMPQRFSLYPDLTVGENLRFFADLYAVPKQERLAREERLMEFSRLGPFRNRRAGQLSGGMKQKLALSCTLIHTPKLLILDEPTTGVDPVSRREFWTILRDLAGQGIALLVSTPYMDEALLCDRVTLMHLGRVLASGTPSEISSQFPFQLFIAATDDAASLKRSLIEKGFSSGMIHRFGDLLHLWCRDDGEVEKLRRIGETLGVRLETAAPSVEDTFVAFIQRGEAA